MSTQQAQQQQGLDITTLPVQQLSQLQQRLSQELEHLSDSHARLRAAQARFKDCIRSIKDGVEGKSEGKSHPVCVVPPFGAANTRARATDTPLLVPLTTSLYVPARPAKTATVLVDVGTGYYVEKKTADAIVFYNGKVDDLTKNLGDIERAVGSKNQDLRMVEDVLRGKVLSEQGGQKGQGAGKEGD